MKKLRKAFDRFCFANRNKGIPNLMLYLCLGSGLVYFMTLISQNTILYDLLYFDPRLILKGQIWRLFSYAITFTSTNPLFVIIGLVCYYSLGRAMENYWGTLRFNIFYFSGIILMDVYSMIFGCYASVQYLNLSLFLSFATLYPDTQFLLFFIIPIKARYLAIFNMAVIALGVFTSAFPYNLFPIIALLNYFLFFGRDMLNIFPAAWRRNTRQNFRRPAKNSGRSSGNSGPIVFTRPSVPNNAQTPSKPAYTHRCTVCGRTDVSNPELEFRYCSRCNGYHCYCSDHINNHTHITQ